MKKSLPTMLGILIAAFILIAGPGAGPARAAHDQGLSCYNCHSFSAPNVEPGTTSLSVPSMTQLKEAGWVPGTRVGCVFCHRSNYSSRIPDALSHFAGTTPAGASRHPVARNFVTNSYDNTPFLSNDNITTLQHLDCKDCHATVLVGMPDHDNNWLNSTNANDNSKRTTNPYALKGVSKPTSYDGLCRSCHLSAASFQTFTGKSGAGAAKLVLTSHNTGVDNGANGIRDIDNTLMRTSTPQKIAFGNQCTACHDSHESQNEHLFSDGHELDNTGVAETAITELTNCTNVCHYRGDAAGSYDTHGHGKTKSWDNISLVRDCNFCHDVGKPHNMAATDYAQKYRFPSLDTSWLDNSVFNRPTRSVCATCHSSKPLHSTAKGVVGCLDCHDQHAKNSDNNVMMIRSTNRVAGSLIGLPTGAGYSVGTEAVRFTSSPLYPNGTKDNDFFTTKAYNIVGSQDNVAPGFCDQRACHGTGSTTGTSYIPMSTYLSSGKHTGGNQSPNSNCEGCHKHEDAGGSYAANQSCTSCHGQPPPPADNQAGNSYAFAESLSPHVKHATTYAISCKLCHYKFVDDTSHNTGVRTYQSVYFDNNLTKVGALTPYYNPDNANGLNCENLWCHSDGRGGAPKDNGYKWYITPAPGQKYKLGCNGCHGADPAAFPAVPINTGAHPKHLAQGYLCSTCHIKTVAIDCNLALNALTGTGASHVHADNVRSVNIAPAYDNDTNDANNWNSVTTTCSGISCHGGNAVNWVSDIGLVTCNKCHLANTELNNFQVDQVAARVDNSNTTGWFGSGHGRTTGSYASGNPFANNGTRFGTAAAPNCVNYCHDNTILGHPVDNNPATNFFRLALGTGQSGRTDVTAATANDICLQCHSATGTYTAQATTKVETAHWLTHSAADNNGGAFCWDCHDPHGDNNDYMIQAQVSAKTDNTGGAAKVGLPKVLRNAAFVKTTGDNTTGYDYMDYRNAAFTGICQTCHSTATNYYNQAKDNTTHQKSGSPANPCTGCHSHSKNFAGAGGSNQEQFFDNAYNILSTDCTINYRDMSGHSVTYGTASTSLFDQTQVNCYDCHGTARGTKYYSNECLKCHWEYRTSGTPAHPNSTFEWADPANPANQYATYPVGSAQTSDATCLGCHTGTTFSGTLGGTSAPKVIPTGETWTTGSGHGSTNKLSPFNPGPPAYHCADCHYSAGANTASADARDNKPATFHASRNRKMVRNDNVAQVEYPGPQYTTMTVDQRSTAMDDWCSTKCHRNTTNAFTKDDNVIDHTWSVKKPEAKVAGMSHPTNFAMADNTRFKIPASTDNIALSNYVSGTLPGTGNVVCVSCHDSHGGWDTTKPAGSGLRNMLILSPDDTNSTLCKKCHK